MLIRCPRSCLLRRHRLQCRLCCCWLCVQGFSVVNGVTWTLTVCRRSQHRWSLFYLWKIKKTFDKSKNKKCIKQILKIAQLNSCWLRGYIPTKSLTIFTQCQRGHWLRVHDIDWTDTNSKARQKKVFVCVYIPLCNILKIWKWGVT